MTATIVRDGILSVDGLDIPVSYEATNNNGDFSVGIIFSSIADYGRCRDGKTVHLRTPGGRTITGFISGPFDRHPTKFSVIAGDE